MMNACLAGAKALTLPCPSGEPPARGSACRRRGGMCVSTPKYTFGFSGSYWGQRVTCPAQAKGLPTDDLGASHYCECSPGTRTWLQGYLKTHCNSTNGNVSTSRCSGTNGAMGSFWFALCPAAWACWSSRMYHAIDRLVVPVVMANGAIQPFEDISTGGALPSNSIQIHL